MNQGILVDQITAIQDGRARLKMSQEHLASAAGISARTVVRAESGFRVSGESLRSICAVLDLDAASITPSDGPEGAGVASDEAAAGPAESSQIVLRPVAETRGAGEAHAQSAPTPHADGSPASRMDRVLALGRTPIRPMPWRQLLTLHRAQVSAVLYPLMFLAYVLAFLPMVNHVVPGDTGRWILEAPASQTTATYLNALAAGRQGARPPALFYFVCGQIEGTVSFGYLAKVLNGDCGLSRRDILIETITSHDGTVQTIVGPVGREFGRDLARRLSGDPKVNWKVAFATGRQATRLGWFDPREVPIQDMPRPPDAPSTWVYVTMTNKGR